MEDLIKESVIASMPPGTGKRTINKVVSGLKKEYKRLQIAYADAVTKEAEKRAAPQRAKARERMAEADEEIDKTIKMRAGVRAFMSKKEFLLIRACLHPDKNKHSKAGEAFKIFNGLQDVKHWEIKF